MNARIEKINTIGQNARMNEAKEAADRFNYLCDLEGRVKSLSQRIVELMDVAQALSSNLIPLGKDYNQMIGTNNMFVTDGIDHRLGFRVDRRSSVRLFSNLGATIIGFGIEGGGYSGGSLFFDREGNLIAGGMEQYETINTKVEEGKMKSLLERFDEFENKFYEYVDSL